MNPQPSAPTDPSRIARAGHMTFPELLSLTFQFQSRLDALWQRVLYTHVGIVGVMIYFATTDALHPIPRGLVLFFYTITTFVTIFAFIDAFSGLRAVLADLREFPQAERTTHTQAWVMRQDYARHATRRVVVLALVWLVIAYLLMSPFLPGPGF